MLFMGGSCGHHDGDEVSFPPAAAGSWMCQCGNAHDRIWNVGGEVKLEPIPSATTMSLAGLDAPGTASNMTNQTLEWEMNSGTTDVEIMCSDENQDGVGYSRL